MPGNGHFLHYSHPPTRSRCRIRTPVAQRSSQRRFPPYFLSNLFTQTPRPSATWPIQWLTELVWPLRSHWAPVFRFEQWESSTCIESEFGAPILAEAALDRATGVGDRWYVPIAYSNVLFCWPMSRTKQQARNGLLLVFEFDRMIDTSLFNVSIWAAFPQVPKVDIFITEQCITHRLRVYLPTYLHM